MECSLSEFEEEGWVDGCVGGWVGAQERQDKTQDSRQERTYFYLFPNIFFWPKKEHHPQTKIRFELRDLKPALRSQENQFLKSNLSGSLSLSLIKERRRFHRLPSTYTTFWMDGSLTFHKQTFFPSQNLLQICSLSLSHTHTIHHLFYKIPTPNSTGNHNLDEEEEEGIEP